jgi:hypothetical protein
VSAAVVAVVDALGPTAGVLVGVVVGLAETAGAAPLWREMFKVPDWLSCAFAATMHLSDVAACDRVSIAGISRVLCRLF